ncbi:hypothetical protein [Natronobacterium lacisalsi]|nr:hypothetical protein [Halobiforma lacisalsi]
MKKGTLAATALAVGAGTTASTAAAQQDDDGEVVLTGSDYYPDVDADVLAELETGTRDTILENFEGTFDPVDDWDLYIVQFDIGSGTVLGHLFVDEDEADVSEGDTVTLSGDASFRDAEANLLEVSTGGGGASDDEDEDEDEEEDEDMGSDDTEDNGVGDDTEDDDMGDDESDGA